MHPVPSIIAFTTASGAGYGLLFLLAVTAPAGLLPTGRWFGLTALLLALGLITFGLSASLFHLGHPERAWRALSQWRSSWLSREGLMALLTYPPALAFGAGWVLAETPTGLFTLLFDLGLAPQLILFAVYAVLAVMVGKRWYGEPGGKDERHAINDPARRMIGRTVTVVTDVDDHGGRVRVGDGEWNARGGPAAAGERVTVTSVEGNCLIVEAVRTLPPA